MQVVALLGPGAVVGEKGVLEKQQREATLVAVVDSLLYRLPRSEFAKLAVEYPKTGLKILEWLLSRSSLRLDKSSARLAQVL